MKNNEVLKAVRSIFGADIVKDAYLEDENDFSVTDEVINNRSLSVMNSKIIVEFINGRKISIKGVYGWADIDTIN